MDRPTLGSVSLGLVTLLAVTLAGCAPEPTSTPEVPTPGTSAATAGDLTARAEALAHELVIVDTHVDLPYRLMSEHGGELVDLAAGTEGGHFDLPRARAGGLDAPFMSIYVPAELQGNDGAAKAHADALIDLVAAMVERWPDQLVVATSPDQVRSAHAAGRMALPMGMENGAPVGDELADLEHFFDRGIRYVTLTHSENNQICDSSYATEKTWGGLSPYGRELVMEMNRLGVMIDVSHVSDQTFQQVMELTEAPVIASHSSCRAFTPGFERNMSDEMIRRLADNGGVIQINFGSAFLTPEANAQLIEAWGEVQSWLDERGLGWGDPQAQEQMEAYFVEHERVETRLSDVADHVDHVVSLVGADHVGIGSDFDGVSALPIGLEDASRYPALIAELLERGYSEEDVAKIFGENLLRVWAEVERVAADLAAGEG